MIRINIVTEGRTEEKFVTNVLSPYLADKEIFLTPRNIGRGNSYDKIKFNVIQWLKEDQTAWVTTMFDLYGQNDSFPGYLENKNKNPYEKIIAIESAFKADIDAENLENWKFIPYFQLHEFEAYLFSDTLIMESWLNLDYTFQTGSFQQIRDQFDSPEHINDSVLTAPSKRILSIIPSYSKVADGVLISEDIGIDKIRQECRHFNEWLTNIENL